MLKAIQSFYFKFWFKWIAYLNFYILKISFDITKTQ